MKHNKDTETDLLHVSVIGKLSKVKTLIEIKPNKIICTLPVSACDVVLTTYSPEKLHSPRQPHTQHVYLIKSEINKRDY